MAYRVTPGLYHILPALRDHASPVRVDSKNAKLELSINCLSDVGEIEETSLPEDDIHTLWEVSEVMGDMQTITSVAFNQAVGVNQDDVRIPENPELLSITDNGFGYTIEPISESSPGIFTITTSQEFGPYFAWAVQEDPDPATYIALKTPNPDDPEQHFVFLPSAENPDH